MVFLDHAPRQREAQPPAAPLGREPGLEGVRLIRWRHAPAVVLDHDLHHARARAVLDRDPDEARMALERRDRVREQVLEGPFHQLGTEVHGRDLIVALLDVDLARRLRQPPPHVLHGFAHDRSRVQPLEAGRRAHVAEALGDLGQPVEVARHVSERLVQLVPGDPHFRAGAIGLAAQQLDPSHER